MQAIADMLHEMGREFGATTGRARRCGWFDAVATRYATMINGIDELAITNLDGLDTVDPIKVCVAYRLDGKKLDVPPCDAAQLDALRADLPRDARAGNDPPKSAKKLSDLPIEARNYVAAHRGTDRRPPDDGQRRSGARPDDLMILSRIEWRRRAQSRFRATSPSSWMAMAAGRRSAGCRGSRATKKARMRCAPASKAAAN